MNTKQFEYVIVLESEGSFTSAAERLNISQPSLSQYIKKIESTIGCELFYRDGQRLVPTKAGMVYIKNAKAILSKVRNMELEIHEIVKQGICTVSIGVSHSRSTGQLSRVISEFGKLYPDKRINIHEKTVADLENDMDEGRYDLYIMPNIPEKEGFEAIKIYEEKLMFAVPFEIANKMGIKCLEDGKFDIIDVKTLANMPFVALFDGQPVREKLRELCEKWKINVNIKANCEKIETAYALAAEGLGIAIVPSSMIDERKSSLVHCCLDGFEWGRDVYAIYPHECRHREAVLKLTEMLRK